MSTAAAYYCDDASLTPLLSGPWVVFSPKCAGECDHLLCLMVKQCASRRCTVCRNEVGFGEFYVLDNASGSVTCTDCLGEGQAA